MATRKFKFKHIAQDASQHVGDAGELILDTATNTLKVSNGSTAGGVTLNTDGTSGVSFTSKTADFNAEASVKYVVSTTGNTVTATLPGSPSTGADIYFADGGGNYATNNLTVARNGNTIMGLVYNGATWRIY
jgi:hypothetical protein